MVKIHNRVKLDKLNQLEKRGNTHFLIGYPTGVLITRTGLDAATLAKILVENKLGKNHRGWNFLKNGIEDNKGQIMNAVAGYLKGDLLATDVGFTAVESIQDYVTAGYYIGYNPNALRYLRRKIKATGGEMRPLIVSSEFIKACTYKIVDKE